MSRSAATPSSDSSLAQPLFWRDPALPFLEIRTVQDGRQVCYARHSHEHFSIGAITGGVSHYLSLQDRYQVAHGSVVLMNPGEVHACNPIANQAWSYHMLYVDTAWLAQLQVELGLSANQDFHCFSPRLSEDARLFGQLQQLVATCRATDMALLGKQEAATSFFAQLHSRLQTVTPDSTAQHKRLQRVAEFIDDQYVSDLRLEDICAASSLSASYLIRAFRQRYHMTPHEYLLDRRIRRGKTLLRSGQSIAQVAQTLGFADQAHFQRTFKRLVAATPGQYCRSSG
ncbi:AraC family transcriptional regulator [Aquitalea sp. LB_tupeE]|uniref:helix-turn-helix transcriptional regulator n=1 Tax=Aquitalea sp. LB_tupeE TaxID=2748078 RepID=UPI0015BFE72E|nr:AraC family transcriptional regulator [Aquitalea sp. LB_tupeE]NWK79235.1 AraC family transcriptional regulator [Aquitalea sp. LB_tupeE]